MPIITDVTKAPGWIEPDDVPRPVVAYGIASNDIGAIELGLHRHSKSQILLVQRGALSCEVEGGLWIVPPRSAIWIPGGAFHAVKATGALEGYCAFIMPHADRPLPSNCCTISVTPLLRELLFRAAALPLFHEEGGANSRLTAVLLDEIVIARIEDLHLPMPTDPRLRAIVDLMIASPSHRGTLETWSKRVGLSERTFARLIKAETGMSFCRWRQQLGIVLAVQWLADGVPIQQVATDIGYESVPSFATMFRKTLGTSPRKYMTHRLNRRQADL